MRALCLLAVLCATAVASAQGFTVEKFDAKLNLRSDGVLEVTESIAVRFTEKRHGIYRKIPVATENGRGGTRAIRIRDVRASERVDLSQADGVLSIRLGDPAKELLPTTSKTYVIHYRVENALNWFDRNAELYWNVTGDRWTTALKKTSLQITFPQVPGDSDVKARIFAGPRHSPAVADLPSVGKTTNPQASAKLTRDTMTLTREAPLAPGNGLTIALSVPASTVARPSAGLATLWFVEANPGLLIPVAVLLLGLAVILLIGRNPAPGPLPIQFEPPNNLGPAECALLLRGKVGRRDLTAALVSLASKGYLSIKVVEEGLTDARLATHLNFTGKPDGPDLTAFEAALLSILKRAGPDITEAKLRRHVAPRQAFLYKALYDDAVRRGYYAVSPDLVRSLFTLVGLFVIALLGFTATFYSPTSNLAPTFVGCLASIPLLILFARLAPRRTALGAEEWARVRGFRDFIHNAQNPELEWMSRNKPNQALFERFLPHAIAFGLTDPWLTAFQGVATQPEWFEGGTESMLIARGNGSLDHKIHNLSASLNTSAFAGASFGAATGGSAFSGSGGAGGGFGGGGGGSW